MEKEYKIETTTTGNTETHTGQFIGEQKDIVPVDATIHHLEQVGENQDTQELIQTLKERTKVLEANLLSKGIGSEEKANIHKEMDEIEEQLTQLESNTPLAA